MIFITEIPVQQPFISAKTDNVCILCRKDNGTYTNYCVVKSSGNMLQYDDCRSLLADDISEVSIKHPNGFEMSIYIQNGSYSIGIIDEENGIIYYYDNKNDQEGAVELHGKTFPYHMISKCKNAVCAMIEDFIQTGMPSKATNWMMEEF